MGTSAAVISFVSSSVYGIISHCYDPQCDDLFPNLIAPFHYCISPPQRIEMTLDGAIRVVNWRCNVSIALASSSNSAALIHPNGRVLQYHSRVEIMTYDGKNKNNFVRFAKIWYKGISFTSENNALVYLVDSGGTRTTTDTFMDLRNDITEQVFLTGSTHGPAYDNQAKKEVMNHKYWPALDGTEVHELNGFRIAQTVDGMVR